ncbi:MAG: uroporphyrinogen-III synthase [Gammaproteobacteria bacterium]
MPQAADDLRGLGVLVTRPAGQAEPLCALITAAGGRPYRLPCLSIEPVDAAAQQQAQAQLRQLHATDLLIFISANAVQFCQSLLGPGRDWLAGAHTASIGRATARAFSSAFARPPDLVPSGDSTSEALLARPELQQVEGRRIFIIRGEGGRTLLADTLQQRGAEVHYVNVYRRGLPPFALTDHLDALRREVDVITSSSTESLRNLVQLLGEPLGAWLWSRPLFVIHQRQVAPAQALGFKIIPAVAATTSDEALLSAIIEWRREHAEQ